MGEYEVRLATKASKSLESLDVRVQERVIQVLDALEDNPYRRGVEKLSGRSRSMYRARVGDYRIVFEVDEEQRLVNVIRVAHRREVYR